MSILKDRFKNKMRGAPLKSVNKTQPSDGDERVVAEEMLPIKSRTYKCDVCGTEDPHVKTNHTSQVFNHCKGCSWKGDGFAPNNSHHMGSGPPMRTHSYVKDTYNEEVVTSLDDIDDLLLEAQQSVDPYVLGHSHGMDAPHPVNPHPKGSKDHDKWRTDYHQGLKDRGDEMAEETEHLVESTASDELVLHADNDSHLYHSSHLPIVKNLAKKKAKGVYQSHLATKLWGYHADRAAQSYHKQYGSKDTPWHKMFSKADRNEAAAHWEKTADLHEGRNPYHSDSVPAAHRTSNHPAILKYNDAREREEEEERKKGAADHNQKVLDRLKKPVKEEVELLADGKVRVQNKLKRKYLGTMRGRTMTGKQAHVIDVKPTIEIKKTAH